MLPIFNISLIGRVDARGLNGPLVSVICVCLNVGYVLL